MNNRERVEVLENSVVILQDELGNVQVEINDLQSEDTLINVSLLEIKTDIYNIENEIDGTYFCYNPREGFLKIFVQFFTKIRAGFLL